MTWLLFAGAALMAGIIGFLVLPLVRSQRAPALPQHHEILIVRDRLLAQLNELDAERADHGVDQQVAQDEELRLSGELAEILRRLESAASVKPEQGQASGRRLWITTLVVLSLAIPAVAVGLYTLQNGAVFKNLARLEEGRSISPQVPPMVLEMVARLEKRLAEQPNDAAGWARLGISYANLGRMGDAREAYAKAYALAPDNMEVLVDYAWVLYSENPKNTEGKVFELYTRIYRDQPQNPDALWFLGLAAFQQGDYAKTIKYWDRLQKVLPPDSPALENVRAAIAQARETTAGT